MKSVSINSISVPCTLHQVVSLSFLVGESHRVLSAFGDVDRIWWSVQGTFVFLRKNTQEEE
jgi:hypothetical protein